MPNLVEIVTDHLTGEILSDKRRSYTVHKVKFTKLFNDKMNTVLKQIGGETLKFLIYMTTSGLVRFGENTFMMNEEVKKQITTDLGINEDSIYRHLRSLKKLGVVEKIGNGCYRISKEHLEYGKESDDFKKKDKT
jgi:predicted HTH transcriptional regulator